MTFHKSSALFRFRRILSEQCASQPRQNQKRRDSSITEICVYFF